MAPDCGFVNLGLGEGGIKNLGLGEGQVRKEPDQDGRSWSGPKGARPGDGRLVNGRLVQFFHLEGYDTLQTETHLNLREGVGEGEGNV